MSCGLRRIWEKVLESAGLSTSVSIIAGGRIADGCVVTAEVKAALVDRLRDTHQLYVWAFGDGVLDLPMLGKAQQAVVVVGEEHTRSKSMDAALLKAIDNHGLRARQALLPGDASPRLDTAKLPLVRLNDHEFIDSVLRRRTRRVTPRISHATDRNAARLLMTPMRDARVTGPPLREAHRLVGWYLAVEFLADLMGAENYPIPHVQGHQTSGHRLCHEQKTTIVALMRGGEPMALGVSAAFPLAMFIHASRAGDLKSHHLQQQGAVLLVDSVVNSGESVLEFVRHIRSLHATIRIVVVAGVVQSRSMSESVFAQELDRDVNLGVVALRLSDNKFTGRGTTDTGNRLFNTTHLC